MLYQPSLACNARAGEMPLIEMNVRQSIFINMPVEKIFTYISDLENLVDWSNPIIAIRKLSPGAIRVGATVQSTIRFLGHWCNVTFEIVECEPGRSLTIKSITGIAPCLFYYHFEPGEDGGTTISQEAILHLTGSIYGLEEPVLARMVSRQIEHDMLTLKDMLEANAASQ
jgi:uncharacterized membrane protein